MRMTGRVGRQAMQMIFEDVEHDPLQDRAQVRRGSACGARVELLHMGEQAGESGRQMDGMRFNGLTIGLGSRNRGVERFNVRMIQKSATKRLKARVSVILGGSPLPFFPRGERRILVGIVGWRRLWHQSESRFVHKCNRARLQNLPVAEFPGGHFTLE